MEMRELDSRANDGIQVRLLWSENDGRVAVSVDDSKTGESFILAIRDPRHALHAFRHPFAYAAAA